MWKIGWKNFKKNALPPIAIGVFVGIILVGFLYGFREICREKAEEEAWKEMVRQQDIISNEREILISCAKNDEEVYAILDMSSDDIKEVYKNHVIEKTTPNTQETAEKYVPIEVQVEGMFNETYSMQDLFEIAATVMVEARDLSDECQRAVVSVIINRVKHKNFPNTVHEVIWQNGQYEGSIKGTVNKYIDIFENNLEVSDDVFEMYERVLENTMYVLETGQTLPDEEYVYQSMSILGDDDIQIDTEHFGKEN